MEIIHVTYRPYCNYYLSIRSAYRRSIIRITLSVRRILMCPTPCHGERGGFDPRRARQL